MPSLYLHVPFCRRKCPYCDFYSVPMPDPRLSTYPDALIRHLELARESGWSGPFATVFFGGGTPSLLPPAAVGKILAAASALFGLDPDAEISLEANPGTVDPEILAGYRAAGVNRLSLGIQSLRQENLELLGRIHSPQQARRAVRWAREAGFDDLSCDLMFALPGESLSGLRREVEEFLALEPDHLSCYGLAVEEGTPFHRLHRAGALSLPEEDEYARHFLGVHEWLTAFGFDHYEISNYARPGRQSRHNRRYWQRRGYLGVGAGAHSFCSRGWGERSAVPGDLDAYVAKVERGEEPAEDLEHFDRRGAMAETLYLGLRTAEGVCGDAFRRRFAAPVEEVFPQAVAELRGRLRQEEGRWCFTPEDWLLYDTLILPFL